jgi:hypothetical protein
MMETRIPLRPAQALGPAEIAAVRMPPITTSVDTKVRTAVAAGDDKKLRATPAGRKLDLKGRTPENDRYQFSDRAAPEGVGV